MFDKQKQNTTHIQLQSPTLLHHEDRVKVYKYVVIACGIQDLGQLEG
jgi:hypothetical protein